VTWRYSRQTSNLFYYQCPMVDCLAVFLALVSLYGYVRWDSAEPRHPLGFFLLLLLAGALATLIKNPVYLPFFIAILAHAAVRHRLRLARRWDSMPLSGQTAHLSAGDSR
jgi:4-amino-4-deoxy-L-arabinose transferase-like glycosyltransferase